MDKLYTVQEIAKALIVHEVTVWRWLESGKLKGFKVTRCWRVTETELNKFLGLNGRVLGEESDSESK